MKKIAIFGTSGFASEIADICTSLDFEEIVYLTESDKGIETKNGLSILSENSICDLMEKGFVFAIGVADPNIREKIALNYSHICFANLIHPSATFGRNQKDLLTKSKGLVIAAGACFMSGIEVGDFVVVGLNATVGHDSVLKSYTSIMPGANISGNVYIDEKVYIGSGAVVLQGSDDEKLYLCKSLVVGAGAVVTKSIYNSKTVVGVPARKLK